MAQTLPPSLCERCQQFPNHPMSWLDPDAAEGLLSLHTWYHDYSQDTTCAVCAFVYEESLSEWRTQIMLDLRVTCDAYVRRQLFCKQYADEKLSSQSEDSQSSTDAQHTQHADAPHQDAHHPDAHHPQSMYCPVCRNWTDMIGEAESRDRAKQLVVEIGIFENFHANDLRAVVEKFRNYLLETGAWLDDIFKVHETSPTCAICRYTTGTISRDDFSYEFEQLSEEGKTAVWRCHRLPRVKLEIFQKPLKVELYRRTQGNQNSLQLEEYQLNPNPENISQLNMTRDYRDCYHTGWSPVPIERLPYRTTAGSRLPEDRASFVPFFGENYGNGRALQDEFDWDLGQTWISRCETDHATACSSSHAHSFPESLILIDVEEACLYTVQPNERPQYCALTYVWGGVNQPQLLSEVREELHVPGAVLGLELAQTVSDAMYATLQLGIRYLWVDALCIVQDDDGIRKAQIKQMQAIYSTAVLTIVAASGSDCNHGLPGVANPGLRLSNRQAYHLPGLSLIRVPEQPNYMLEKSTWRTRGWTFQEELCSNRALIFLPHLVIFSCSKALWREDIILESSSERPKGGLQCLPSHESSREGHVSTFRALVKQYLTRRLTRPDDIDDGFAGVAALLEPLIGPLYHGVPERYFGEVLLGCWFWDTILARRSGFPSWSWTGWIYSSSESDMGIDVIGSAGHPSAVLLAFFKFSSEVEPLANSDTSALLQLHDHFIPDSGQVRGLHEQMLTSSRDKSNQLECIAFFTSVTRLEVRPSPGPSPGLSREYRVLHPNSRKHLTTVRLKEDFVRQHGNMHNFIVIGRGSLPGTFRLMLIQFNDVGTATKVNVTVAGRPVKEGDWWETSPRKQLVVLD